MYVLVNQAEITISYFFLGGLPDILMSEQEKASREILLDVREARLRSYAGTTVQTILKAWLRRKNLWYFFRSDLEMALVYVDRKLYIEIRRRNVRENPESLIRNK